MLEIIEMGESTLRTWEGGGGHFGQFDNMYATIIFQNMLHLTLDFTLGVWAWYFDFHKVNNIQYYLGKKSILKY
jgi:hypothetical protein